MMILIVDALVVIKVFIDNLSIVKTLELFN